MKEKINIAYGRNFLFLNSIYKKIINYKRNEINNLFFSKIKISKKSKLLDVGTTSSIDLHQNKIVKEFPIKKNITCFSNQNLKNIKKIYPDIKIKKGDAKRMSFKNNSFDIVACTATIEHVGNDNNQLKLLSECLRVSKKYIFLTTPNRWFPIELHTRLPLLHFLPKSIFRKILKFFGDDYLSKEENLNLLSKKQIVMYLNFLKIKNYKIYNIYLLNFCSNYVIIIKK